ncbi:MAG: SGNH/GDSL hydrolase family protein [Oligoflexia bacterium]|nr:SGNH/GDSL hydrolase family protein [Oligoflexia bacterium]
MNYHNWNFLDKINTFLLLLNATFATFVIFSINEAIGGWGDYYAVCYAYKSNEHSTIRWEWLKAGSNYEKVPAPRSNGFIALDPSRYDSLEASCKTFIGRTFGGQYRYLKIGGAKDRFSPDVPFNVLGKIKAPLRYSVACYYYDPTKPYPKTASPTTPLAFPWTPADFVNNRPSPDLYYNRYFFRVNGHTEEGFFIVDDEAQSYGELKEVCMQTISKNCGSNFKLHRMAAYLHDRDTFEFPISFRKKINKNNFIFDEILIFGDSLSDWGNLVRWLRVMPLSPYFMGHFSNGHVWNEILSERLDNIALDNWAYGGAKTTQVKSANDLAIHESIKSIFRGLATGFMSSVIDKYLDMYRPTKQDTARKLVVLWGGGNNYLEKEDENKASEYIRAMMEILGGESRRVFTIKYVNATVGSIIDSMRSLYKQGGYRIFLLLTLPDMSKVPMVKDNQRLAGAFKFCSEEHNRQLAAGAADFQNKHPDTKVMLFRIEDAMNELISEKSRVLFELDNVTDQCYQGGYMSDGSVCHDQKHNAFWDGVHPTHITHCLLTLLLENFLIDQGAVRKEKTSREGMAQYCMERAKRPEYNISH